MHQHLLFLCLIFFLFTCRAFVDIPSPKAIIFPSSSTKQFDINYHGKSFNLRTEATADGRLSFGYLFTQSLKVANTSLIDALSSNYVQSIEFAVHQRGEQFASSSFFASSFYSKVLPLAESSLHWAPIDGSTLLTYTTNWELSNNTQTAAQKNLLFDAVSANFEPWISSFGLTSFQKLALLKDPNQEQTKRTQDDGNDEHGEKEESPKLHYFYSTRIEKERPEAVNQMLDRLKHEVKERDSLLNENFFVEEETKSFMQDTIVSPTDMLISVKRKQHPKEPSIYDYIISFTEIGEATMKAENNKSQTRKRDPLRERVQYYLAKHNEEEQFKLQLQNPSEQLKSLKYQPMACKEAPHAYINRQVLKTGFHRTLETRIQVAVDDANAEYQQIELIETLPAGIYVDIYELAEIERLGDESTVARTRVFNRHVDLEKPETISSPVYMSTIAPLRKTRSETGSNVLEATISTPIHFRYLLPSEVSTHLNLTIFPPQFMLLHRRSGLSKKIEDVRRNIVLEDASPRASIEMFFQALNSDAFNIWLQDRPMTMYPIIRTEGSGVCLVGKQIPFTGYPSTVQVVSIPTGQLADRTLVVTTTLSVTIIGAALLSLIVVMKRQ